MLSDNGSRERLTGKYLLEWIVPALFALLVSNTIRAHSLAPMPTMARTVGNLLAVAAVAMVVLMAAGRRLVVGRNSAILLLALTGSVTVSVLGSGAIDYSLQRLELYLVMALLGLIAYLAYRDHDRLPLAAFFAGVALVHLPYLLAVIVWIRDLVPPFWNEGFRAGDFANVRQYAEFGFFAAVCGSGMGLLTRRLAIPSFLLAGAGVFGIVLTGSRGAALAWILFVLLACGFSRARLRAAAHGVMVALVAAGLVWYLDRSGMLPSPNLFARAAGIQSGTESLDATRLDLWWKSLHQVIARPLFGSGPEGYWLSECCNQKVMQAHNFVLQFLMEFGAVGCIIALLLLMRAVVWLGGSRSAIAMVLATPENRVLACLLAAFLAYSLIDQTMYHLVPLLHFSLFAGLFCAGLARAHATRASRLNLDMK